MRQPENQASGGNKSKQVGEDRGRKTWSNRDGKPNGRREKRGREVGFPRLRGAGKREIFECLTYTLQQFVTVYFQVYFASFSAMVRHKFAIKEISFIVKTFRSTCEKEKKYNVIRVSFPILYNIA